MSEDWVTRRFGVELVDGDGVPLGQLVSLAVRRNPRRAQLLVSRVLGKHVPVDPRVVREWGRELGRLVAASLDQTDPGAGSDDLAVLAFAETATGLGHWVADELRAPYLHSTRRRVATARPLAGFVEEHSHAAQHQLLPENAAILNAGTLVLVDDELSTGRTAMNTIAELHRLAPRERYVLASLVDLRSSDARAALADFADSLGVQVSVVACGSGGIELPDGLVAAVTAELASTDTVPQPPDHGRAAADVHAVEPTWPAGAREAGRHGYSSSDVGAARRAAARVADRLRRDVQGPRVLVLGTEELMYAPTLIALRLAEAADLDVRVSSTTRSPVVVVDEPGYPIRSGITFSSHDHPADGPGERFAYNTAGPFGGKPADDIVVVVDDDSDPVALGAGLVAALRPLCRRLHVVTLPCHRPLPEALRAPAFGSYEPGDVTWLLSDLSEVPLEAPVEDREEAIQSGGAHYAQSLPIEYQPDASYLRLFDQALDESAARVAHATGIVTELVLAERTPRPVLVSLARAGTPVGVLMRRWAARRHGLDLPHHTLSIVRGRGIDTVALRWLTARYDPCDVIFVDGWTGKGAIARELSAAIAEANAVWGTAFDPSLTVLADPGHCVTTFGTREDFLVPSACLNSTVSGLVSRTVLNEDVLEPGQFHGAKFYRELAGADVSARFVDTVADRFDEVAGTVARDWPRARLADRTPSWAGWAEVERIAAEHDIDDVTLVKPGVGETTRVLLRRVPWTILVRAGDVSGLAHIRVLAQQRGVPIRDVDDLTFRCVGIIHPRYTRGASGRHGTGTVTAR